MTYSKRFVMSKNNPHKILYKNALCTFLLGLLRIQIWTGDNVNQHLKSIFITENI